MRSLQLICLPFAGAHMDPFFALRAHCESVVPGLATATLTYPGHGRRIGESALPTIEAMAYDALDQLDRLRVGGDRDLVLLGYSMGSLVAYELSFLLADLGHPIAGAIFMAATPPAHVAGTGLDLGTDEKLLEHCLQYGLIAPNDLPSPALRQLLLPALRSDILAVDGYPGAIRGRRQLDAEVSAAVFQGDADLTVAHRDRWDDIAPNAPLRQEFVGGHFFINDARDAVADAVAERLTHLANTPVLERLAS